MIINTGQRTDIPAFYSEWFFKRIEEGYVYVRNPYYQKRITKFILDPTVVDCLCFCTKNPLPMLKRLDEIKNYRQFWFVTITPYLRDVEPYVPHIKDVLLSFKQLSLNIGKKAIGWRYDPIFINGKYDVEYHLKAFHYMAKELSGYTDKCVISFIDLYEKTKINFPDVQEVPMDIQHYLVRCFVKITKRYGMKLYCCDESKEFSRYGAICSGCMSLDVIEEAIGIKLDVKVTSIREGCQCLLGNDIGAYNSCLHGCLYCYANVNQKKVMKRSSMHDPLSPLLIGHVEKDDIIVDAKQKSSINGQLSFDI